MKIRRELHLIKTNGRCSKPPAAYALTRAERRIFCLFLKSVRFWMATLQTWTKMLLKNKKKFMVLNRMIAIFCRSVYFQLQFFIFLQSKYETYCWSWNDFFRNSLHGHWKLRFTIGRRVCAHNSFSFFFHNNGLIVY